ncbi:hypothetical protein OS493_019257 [Desmophyllum pertusum]|uniref:Uncharacterized protein n=1 Tax=Desmophyllum pertusum TaxID=174260 RepID=A0A9W9YC06_9CNID|nr:hypothetical protein OS493_019257 [Desmophyllum pertusum]
MSKDEDAFIPHSNFPCGADGSGYYSDNTLCCYKLIYEAAPLVLDAIKLASVKPGSVFTIADYGCADGGTSMPLLYTCVQELRKIHGDDFSINVIYEDQPVNDFKSLFLRLQGFMPGPKSYLLNFPDVFVTTCGTNFYSQCFPPQTVNLAFSATAFHWLNIKPCDITGALDHTMITIPEEAEVSKKQAAKDWETILLNRAKELAPGSRMILVQLVIDKEGQRAGTTKGTRVSAHHMLSELWQGLVTDGLITQLPREEVNGLMDIILRSMQLVGHASATLSHKRRVAVLSKVNKAYADLDKDKFREAGNDLFSARRLESSEDEQVDILEARTENEFHNTTFAYYVRTENEFRKPFESKDSPVRKAGLSLISVETKVVLCPYKEKWLKNGGDPKEHAHWYIPAIRAWSNTTFASGLSDSRSSEEKERIVDELFQRYENEVAKCPEDHGLTLSMLTWSLEKRRGTPFMDAALLEYVPKLSEFN